MRALVRAGLLLALGVVAAGVAENRQARAGWFDVPEGFVAIAEAEPPPHRDWRVLLTIQPEDGAFANLSRLSLHEVVTPVTDPDAWLQERISADLGSGDKMRDALTSPDSPFADPAFDVLREALPKLFDGLEQLSRLPLSFCDAPTTAHNAAGPLRELYCVFQVGPFRQYLLLRLQESDGRWFYTTVRAMNERRFRQFVAIANSFHGNGRVLPDSP